MSNPEKQLAAMFARRPWLFVPDEERRQREGQAYKKGYEIRLVAESESELETIRQNLLAAGFPAANPFFKRNRWIQPLYGREAVERFCILCGYHSEASPD